MIITTITIIIIKICEKKKKNQRTPELANIVLRKNY
jgi:hypothetical protein